MNLCEVRDVSASRYSETANIDTKEREKKGNQQIKKKIGSVEGLNLRLPGGHLPNHPRRLTIRTNRVIRVCGL